MAVARLRSALAYELEPLAADRVIRDAMVGSLTPGPSLRERGVITFAVGVAACLFTWGEAVARLFSVCSIYSPLLERGAGGEAFVGEAVVGEASVLRSPFPVILFIFIRKKFFFVDV